MAKKSTHRITVAAALGVVGLTALSVGDPSIDAATPEARSTEHPSLVQTGTGLALGLIRAARNSDPVLCEIAGNMLGLNFFTSGLPPVVSAMRPSDPVAAEVGAWTMRPIQGNEPVAPLAAALGDQDPCVRNLAGRLLGRTRHADATAALSPERLARLCQGECYQPSDRRRPITRIEVVRIRPQASPGEDIAALVEDPWRVLPCEPDPAGCQVAFGDEEFASSGRDVLYYVRAIEAPSPAVDADPLGCTRDESGRCVELKPCSERPADDECLSLTEERAWSSPIFVNRAP